MTDYRIRPATEADAVELLAIYRPYVEKTAITFEYEVPTVEEFKDRIRHKLERYPYIVVESTETGKTEILGYAYASPFKERAAYDWSVELSVYVREDCKGKGIGKKLYAAMEKCLKAQGICNLYACIGVPSTDANGNRLCDEHLDMNSVDFHSHMGYELIGEFHKCGYKFDRWYSMVWMEKMIGEHEKSEPIHIFTAEML